VKTQIKHQMQPGGEQLETTTTQATEVDLGEGFAIATKDLRQTRLKGE